MLFGGSRGSPPLLKNLNSSPLRVGIVGFGWMGQVHARAYARLRQHYPQSPLAPILVAVADNAADTRLAQAVAAYGSPRPTPTGRIWSPATTST